MRPADSFPLSNFWQAKYPCHDALTLPQAEVLTGIQHGTLYLRVMRAGMTLDEAMYYQSPRKASGMRLVHSHDYSDPFDMIEASLLTGVPLEKVYKQVRAGKWNGPTPQCADDQ